MPWKHIYWGVCSSSCAATRLRNNFLHRHIPVVLEIGLKLCLIIFSVPPLKNVGGSEMANLRSVLIQINHVLTLIRERKMTVKIASFQKNRNTVWNMTSDIYWMTQLFLEELHRFHIKWHQGNKKRMHGHQARHFYVSCDGCWSFLMRNPIVAQNSHENGSSLLCCAQLQVICSVLYSESLKGLQC